MNNISINDEKQDEQQEKLNKFKISNSDISKPSDQDQKHISNTS